MGQLGYAAMLTWHDVTAGGDDEHEHWHSHEHIAERVGRKLLRLPIKLTELQPNKARIRPQQMRLRR